MKQPTLKAFLLGMWEFRSEWTTHIGGIYINAYDTGRELAHRLTFRRYEK